MHPTDIIVNVTDIDCASSYDLCLREGGASSPLDGILRTTRGQCLLEMDQKGGSFVGNTFFGAGQVIQPFHILTLKDVEYYAFDEQDMTAKL